jgi:hypothetical protein
MDALNEMHNSLVELIVKVAKGEVREDKNQERNMADELMALVIGPATKERISRAVGCLYKDAQEEIQKLINSAYENKNQNIAAREHVEGDIAKELDGSIDTLRKMLKNTENTFDAPSKWPDMVGAFAIMGLSAIAVYFVAEKSRPSRQGLQDLRNEIRMPSPEEKRNLGR